MLITGVSRFLGLRLAKKLERADDVGLVVGVDVEEPPVHIEKLDFVRADIRSPLIARVLDSTNVDTVVHTNIASSPSRFGGRSQMKENNVIGTMQLLAAVHRARKINKVVMKSSAAIYGYGPGEPSIVPEDHAARHVDLSGYAKDCAEAETYARDFGRRRRDIDLVVLRTQNVVGPTIRSSLTDYLSLPVIPTALGFDPRLQLLHEEDAVDALFGAMTSDCRGIYNIGAPGIVYLSQAIRLLGRRQLPLLLPAAGLLRRFNLVDFPIDQIKLILYGRVVDIQRAQEAFAFAPRFTTQEALLDFKHRRDPEPAGDPAGRPAWERDLIGASNGSGIETV